MRFVTPSTGFAALAWLAALAVVLPIAESGCGHTACFEYTPGEYQVHNSCPAQADALPNFTDPDCPGPILKVDGPGIFNLNKANPDQSLCCYPVTQQAIDPTFADGCVAPSGTGGAGTGVVNPGDGTVFDGSGFAEVGVSGEGGAGGFSNGNCVSCGAELDGKGAEPTLLCPQAQAPWSALQTCICGSAGACFTQCKLNLCQNATMSQECVSCVMAGATNGCGSELTTCDQN